MHLEDSEAESELLAATLDRLYTLELKRVDSEVSFARELLDPKLDLIISDFTLPSYGGSSALALAQEKRPDLPFIFFSGTLGEEAAVDALRSGATDYILKNRPQKMVSAIERALRERDERRRLKEAESALVRNREGFRTLIENALDVISVLDFKGNFTFNSPSIERILGYTPEELAGLNAFTLVHPDDIPTAQSAFAAATEKRNETVTVELRVKHKNDTWRILELHGKGLLSGGPIEGVVVNSRDVTDKRQTEAQLLRAQRMECLGVLAGGIAHDLNNILSPVLMGTELLKMYVSDPESVRILETIQASSERGSHLVKHILSFARGVKGEPSMLDVKPLIQEVVKLLRDTMPKSIQFQVNLARDLKSVVCNPTELHQVLMNLCVNARDAMPTGGLLQISAVNTLIEPKPQDRERVGSGPRCVRLTIRDNGTGIPPDILPRVFEPFFTTKDEGKGTGLGLSTVLSIVKRNDGKIEVESVIGEGTSFHVWLPAAEADAQDRQHQSQSIPTGHGERILVVDDESAILEITKAILETANYEVEVALNGVQALHKTVVATLPWHLVITDASMPLMDGAAFIAELRLHNPKLPVICTTGENAGDLLERIQREGVQAILPKPYSSKELLLAIDRIFGSGSSKSSQLAGRLLTTLPGPESH